mgnify:CR=1 FL=1
MISLGKIKIFKLFPAVFAALALWSFALPVEAQTMASSETATPTTQQIVCGKNLCTIGDPGNGGHQRVCWEAKRPNRTNKGKYKCFYTCQGSAQEKPDDCKKDEFTCRQVTTSTADCETVDRNSDKYKRYYEAKYSEDEKGTIPLCPGSGGVSKVTCKCGEGYAQVVCSPNRVCEKETHTQTPINEQTSYSRTTSYYCKIPAGSEEAQNADPRNVAGATGTTFTDYGGMTSVEYTDSIACPTYGEYREKYTSGCWSCLVVEKLTSAFLRAASKGLEICQKAGHTLLLLGFALWLAFWGLKNVSSFTEIKSSNILNDLLKMGAKVIIAYYCISAGPAAIREFVITPIMGIGATIAQNFWYKADTDSKYLKSVEYEDFDWDIDPFEDHSEEFNENTVNATSTPVPNQEEQQEIAEMDEQLGAELEIPPFQVPGTNGSLQSFPGCRIPPPTPSGCGSYAHMGLDVGADHHSKIWAMAGGTVTYSKMGGYGNVVVIKTEHKGNRWEHMYAHMDYNDWKKYSSMYAGKKVERGTIIGGVGCTSKGGPGEAQEGRGCAYAHHLHVEVVFTGTIEGKQYNNAILDPVSLGDGKIVVRGHKTNGVQSSTVTADCDCRKGKGPCNKHSKWPGHKPTFDEVHPNKRWCTGFNLQDPNTSIKRGQRFPSGGIIASGIAKVESSGISDSGGGNDFGSMAVEIPDVKYTGPTDIMPKSVMNSIIGAVKAITFNTAQFQILGNIAWCYAGVHGDNGGAYHLKFWKFDFYFTNIGMVICGAIIWFLGFMLTCVVAFYLVDMSFKIGFAVMALPVVMGLWPFKVTQGKLAEVISIITKASCDFAFLALTTYFGLSLVAAVFGDGGMEKLFEDYDKVITESAGSDTNDIVAKLKSAFYLFSSTFLMLLFAIIYSYKLVSKTSKDLVEKFFPDKAFGSASPMHKGLTGAASIANRLNKKYGMGLVGDMAANGIGKGLNKIGNKIGGAARSAPKAALNAARRGINKLKGGGKK